MNYWERLRILKMNSQQRRFERYRIIYTWKILEGLVPNCGLIKTTSDRTGRKCTIPPVKSKTRQSLKSLRYQSFQVHGPQLFNSLPKFVRNTTKCGVEEFKEKLDQYLSNIPDQPKIGTLIPPTCEQFSLSPSNSIVDQVREFHRRNTRMG